MSGNKLNLGALVAALDAKRRAEGISWREVADQAKVSASTLTRLQQDRKPDIDTFAALVEWLGAPADEFFSVEPSVEHPARATVAMHHRGKGRSKLPSHQAQLLSDLLRKAHELARELKG